jgi:hypothetical protein
MSISFYFFLAFLSGLAAKSTHLGLQHPALYRPMAFQSRYGSLIWDIAAIGGGIAGPALFIYGFMHFEVGVPLLGVVFFLIGVAMGQPLTRFGPLSLACNIILISFAVSVYPSVIGKTKGKAPAQAPSYTTAPAPEQKPMSSASIAPQANADGGTAPQRRYPHKIDSRTGLSIISQEELQEMLDKPVPRYTPPGDKAK